jgi:hypothetical protein
MYLSLIGCKIYQNINSLVEFGSTLYMIIGTRDFSMLWEHGFGYLDF